MVDYNFCNLPGIEPCVFTGRHSIFGALLSLTFSRKLPSWAKSSIHKLFIVPIRISLPPKMYILSTKISKPLLLANYLLIRMYEGRMVTAALRLWTSWSKFIPVAFFHLLTISLQGTHVQALSHVDRLHFLESRRPGNSALWAVTGAANINRQGASACW